MTPEEKIVHLRITAAHMASWRKSIGVGWGGGENLCTAARLLRKSQNSLQNLSEFSISVAKLSNEKSTKVWKQTRHFAVIHLRQRAIWAAVISKWTNFFPRQSINFLYTVDY